MLRVGTCSWKYPSWEGLVYDRDSNASYLAQYARTYRTVEVDRWYWALGKDQVGLPDRSTVNSYDADTDSEFRFTIKAPNALTAPFAYRTASEPNRWFLNVELFYRFLDSLSPLLAKTAVVMLQFPYLNRGSMARSEVLLDYLAAFAHALPDSVQVGIEIRNPHWVDHRWFEALKDLGLSPVLLSGYWMESFIDHIEGALSLGFETLTIRLHGDDRTKIEEQSGGNWSAIIRDKGDELTQLAGLLTGRGEEIYLNVNNHYEGSAPLTIKRLYALLEGV